VVPLVCRRALASLAQLLGEDQNLEDRKKAAKKLCQQLSNTDSADEKCCVANALKNLTVEDEEEVWETLFLLLNDPDQNVKIEAGKTLSVLKAPE